MDPNDKVLILLGEIAKWSREGALPAVKERVSSLLDTDAKLRVYDAIREGEVTIRKLEDAGLGVSRDTAQKLVSEWDAAGLLVHGSNPPKALFTLAELGISTPAPIGPRVRE